MGTQDRSTEETFDGKLGTRFVTGIVKLAYDSWRGQRERCSNPKNKAYKHYGAKGCKVLYSSRDFVNWWLRESKKFDPSIKLTVDRLDTSGDYCFENVQLVSWAENVAEANSRCKVKRGEKLLFGYGKIFKDFPLSDTCRKTL